MLILDMESDRHAKGFNDGAKGCPAPRGKDKCGHGSGYGR